MRKMTALALVALTALISLLAACGSSSATTTAGACTTDPSTLKLVQAGKLTIATDASYPPQEYKDASGNLIGMEIDLAKEFAKRLCVTADIKDTTFADIIGAITAGTPGNQRFDMSISAFTINPDRQKVVDMIPYFTAGQSLLVAPGNPKNIKQLSDICGLNVSVEKGTAEESDVMTSLNVAGGTCASKNIKLLSYDTETQAINDVISGRADAAYQDSPVTDYYLGLNTGKVAKGPSLVDPAPEGLVVRKDNNAFESTIIKALSDMRNDGTFKTILTKWNLQSGVYPALP